MFIGTYGTLMVGQPRHGALEGSSFYGRCRLNPFNTLLLKTPAGFPAVVFADESYIQTITTDDISTGWWAQYKKDNPTVVDPADVRTSWLSGLDSALIEVYKINDEVKLSLDIIEGVPHLYNRQPVSISAVRKDNTTLCNSSRMWRTTLSTTQKEMSSDKHIDSMLREAISPRRECYVYYMPPTNDWLQGCDIIWNGDFNNPLIRKDVKYEYNKWLAKLNEEHDAVEEAVEVDADEPIPQPRVRVTSDGFQRARRRITTPTRWFEG